MDDRTCRACSVVFSPINGNQINCSKGCRERARDRSRPARRGRGRRGERICAECGVSFLTLMSGTTKTCGATCRKQLVSGPLLDRSAWPRRPIASPLRIKRCPWCDTIFTKVPGHSQGTYCSMSHRFIATGHSPRHSPIEYGSCYRCGQTFVRRAGCLGDFCGPLCRKLSSKNKRYESNREKRKRNNGHRERFTLSEIGDRDNWTCHLCNELVANVKPSGLKLDPSIDHIVPLSLGGLDVRVNVRLAHMICNARRGVRSVA